MSNKRKINWGDEAMILAFIIGGDEAMILAFIIGIVAIVSYSYAREYAEFRAYWKLGSDNEELQQLKK